MNAMATVWAPFDEAGTGRWHDKAYVTGWSHTVLFASLFDLETLPVLGTATSCITAQVGADGRERASWS